MPHPALIPLHGILDKKPRFLEREAVIIGRSRGCDIGLDAPDISSLHCVISRGPEGYRIRDCASRAGTKLNGISVKAASLTDGDVLQIGPFSFTVQIPEAVQQGRSADPLQVERWKRSRQRLAKQALRLRRRLASVQEKGVCQTPSELQEKAAKLKERIHSYDERFSELEQAERELEAERDKLRKEREEQEHHIQTVEADMSRRLAEVEDQIHRRWQEFQQRCRAEENQTAEASRPHPQSEEQENITQAKQHLEQEMHKLQAELENTAQAKQNLERETEQLAQFKKKLERQAHQLLEEQQQLAQDSEQLENQLKKLDEDQEELDHARQTLAEEKKAWERQLSSGAPLASGGRQPADDVTDDLKAGLANVEASLEEQRQNMARIMAEMEKIHQALRTPSSQPGTSEDVQALLIENAQLQARLLDLEKLIAAATEPSGGDNDDSELLRHLRRLESEQPGLHGADQLKLKSEIERLTHLLQDREQEIESLKKQATPVAKGTVRESDLESYESELNQYRRQLETDREKLNAEIEQLRERNGELNEAVREMEMEMSRERAELARERTRLDRMRDEIRIETERLQRDGPVRESLASVQKLREEMNQRKQTAGGNPLTDRLKGLRGKLAD